MTRAENPAGAKPVATRERDAQRLDAAAIYRAAILREIVPVLSLMDRELLSPTRGCLDRTYWAWKFTDFPGARFQEGLCVLSFVYATPFEDKPYYHSPQLLDWIAGGFDYWSQIQYPGGDFDEAYPFERSLAATAFSSFYLSEAWHFLDGRLPEACAARFKRSLRAAAEWLVVNDETHGFLSNHLAAAAAALLHAARITGDVRFEQRSRYFLEKILDHQSAEGWYDEYGGADPGYQTHGAFYLARCWQMTGDARLLDSLQRSLVFLAHFVHPDGSLGGEYASRNTQTYYPAAFEMLAGKSGAAQWIAEEMLASVRSLAAAGLGTVDSYNYFPLLNNVVFAYLASAQPPARHAPAWAPAPDEAVLHFPEAGLLKVRAARYDLFVGLNKGAVIKLFDRRSGALVYSDCGYIGRLKNGKLFSSQWIDPDAAVVVNEREIALEGNFHQISRPIMRPLRFLMFRGFSLTVGRLPRVSYWLKGVLVKALIYRSRRLPLTFRRTISLAPEGVTVRDWLQGPANHGVDALYWGARFTTIHMGSSRYFIPNEINETGYADGEEVDPAELAQGIVRTRTIPFD